MDIDPVIRKDLCALHHQYDCEIIPVAESLRRPEDCCGRRRIKGIDEVKERHSGDIVLSLILDPLAGRGLPTDHFNPSLAVTNTINVESAERHRATLRQ